MEAPASDGTGEMGIRDMTYEAESKLIVENKKHPRARRRHPFKNATWTHKNGHPRCIVCGDEERIGGMCDGIFEKATPENPGSPALTVYVPRYGLVTKHTEEVWDWIQRVMESTGHVIAEPILRGERATIHVDGPTPVTFEAVINVDPSYGSVARVFDAVTYGSTDLRTRPLRERRRFLMRALGEFGRRDLRFVPWHKVDSRAALARAVARIRRDGAPGLMLKVADVASNDYVRLQFEEPVEAAEWTAAFINTLPDSSFAVVSPGGEKDEEGKTTPRALRHLPFKDADGKVDLPHLRNALARLPQSKLSVGDKAKARKRLTDAARAAGVGEPASKGMTDVAILKQNGQQQVALGVVMEPDVADTQEDGTQAAEIETAANQFMEDYRGGRTILRLGHEMDLDDSDAVLTQHYIAPVDMTINGQAVRAGSWLQAWKYADHLWPRILSGEFTGFSIGGFARREPA